MKQNSRKIIAKLKRDGFELVKVKGSHHKFKKDGKVVIVPHPKKIFQLVQRVLLHNKQAGLKKEKKNEKIFCSCS